MSNENAKVTFDVHTGLTVQIDTYELLRKLSPEQRMDLGRHAAIEETLYQDLVDQLTSGVTDCDSWCSSDELQKLREKLAPLMTEIAAKAVKELRREADAAKADAKRHSDWAWTMRHQWPPEHERSLPPLPNWTPAWSMSNEQAIAIATGKAEP